MSEGLSRTKRNDRSKENAISAVNIRRGVFLLLA